MFLLTCPSCGHCARVKFARIGAVATCSSCKSKFKVDASSLAVESDHTATPTSNIQIEPQSTSPPDDNTDAPIEIEPLDTPAGEEEVVMENAPLEELKISRKTKSKITDKIAAAVSTVRKKRIVRKHKRINTKLVAMLITMSLVLIGLLVILTIDLRRDILPEKIKNTPVVKNSNGVPPDKPAVSDPQSKPPKPDQQKPSKPKQQAPDSISGLALMQLHPLALPKWSEITPPTEPIEPNNIKQTVQWQTWLQPGDSDRPTMVRGLYVADTSKVYANAFLHIQLLNKKGLAFAELKFAVDTPSVRQGVDIRTAIPSDMAEKAQSAVAVLTPIDPIHNTTELEPAPRQTRWMNQGQTPMVLRLAVRNPLPKAVQNPRIVIEALDAHGMSLGTWVGTPQKTISSGQEFAFNIVPPLAKDIVPNRFVVRGYAVVIE